MLLPKLNCKNNIENVILTFISISHVFFPIMLFHMLSGEGLHFSAFHYVQLRIPVSHTEWDLPLHVSRCLRASRLNDGLYH